MNHVAYDISKTYDQSANFQTRIVARQFLKITGPSRRLSNTPRNIPADLLAWNRKWNLATKLSSKVGRKRAITSFLRVLLILSFSCYVLFTRTHLHHFGANVQSCFCWVIIYMLNQYHENVYRGFYDQPSPKRSTSHMAFQSLELVFSRGSCIRLLGVITSTKTHWNMTVNKDRWLSLYFYVFYRKKNGAQLLIHSSFG